MSYSIHCPCGAHFPAAQIRRSLYHRCLNCGRDLSDQMGIDPPEEVVEAEAIEPPPHWSVRMLTALLDPRSIQWMLLIGGGLMVLGLVVWLISLGLFENPWVVAAALTLGSLAVHAAGCALVLKTRYKIAGNALTFLGCVLTPLNLWFYHAQGLVTLEGRLWLGGLLCCGLYVATVLLLRNPLFLYAVEGGITLTVLLLLGQIGVVTDSTWLSLVLLGLAFVSIHAERVFAVDDPEFDRRRYGLPLFWSGQVQAALALCILLGTQIAGVLLSPAQTWFASTWAGNVLTQHAWLAAGMYLAAAYLYFYSDLVVRRVGWYLYAATACVIAAQVTFLARELPAEWLIAAPALTALAITWIATRRESDRITYRLPPLAVALSAVSLASGLLQHIGATSELVAAIGLRQNTGWAFFVVMVLVAVANRVMAVLHDGRSIRMANTHLFFSAGAVLIAAAGLARCLEITSWTQQAPLVMLVPLAYLVAARLQRSKTAEGPLAISAQVGAAVILLHVIFNCVKVAGGLLQPVAGSADNLWLGLVFAEATVFYLAYAVLFRRAENVYAATAAACGVIWQGAAFLQIADEWYTMLYAALGLILLAVGRTMERGRSEAARTAPPKPAAPLDGLQAAYHSANALVSLALVSGLLQGLARLAVGREDWTLLAALSASVVAGLSAIVLAPSKNWRRVYAAGTLALTGVAFVTFNEIVDLSLWQKTELFAVVGGTALLVAGYIGRFVERTREQSDLVTLALWFGSVLPIGALLTATFYYRFVSGEVSMHDELALTIFAVLMLVTGYTWQLKSPTLVGGGGLAVYLITLVGMLAYFPNVAMGVYLAAGGAALFGAGVVLSVFRERLSELPRKISEREGWFQVLSWR